MLILKQMLFGVCVVHNMIGSCLLQYSYSFKSKNNCCSVYMNKTFCAHTPKMNGLLNLDHSDTHIHNIHAKICKVDNDSATYFVALPFRSYWCKAHEETPYGRIFGIT